MNHSIEYIACFVPFDRLHAALQDLGSQRLSRVIPHPHVTVEYLPQDTLQALWGCPCRVVCTGYGNDGTNEGLRVQIFCTEPRLQQLLDRIPLPHITLSVSENGRPVNTAGLQFQDIAPLTVEGIFGGFPDGGTEPVFEA